MSTALKKEQPKQPEKRGLMDDHIVRLEVATETMMAYVGSLTTAIMNEEAQANPDKAKIEALQAEKNRVFQERKNIRPDDEALIAKGIYVYGRIMKAFYNSAK